MEAIFTRELGWFVCLFVRLFVDLLALSRVGGSFSSWFVFERFVRALLVRPRVGLLVRSQVDLLSSWFVLERLVLARFWFVLELVCWLVLEHFILELERFGGREFDWCRRLQCLLLSMKKIMTHRDTDFLKMGSAFIRHMR